MLITIDGDYTLADLEYLGLSACAYDEERWICNIDSAFNDVDGEDYYEEWYHYWFPAIEREKSIAVDIDYTHSYLDYLDLEYDYWFPDMVYWSPAVDRENLSEMTITMDGDHTLADLDHLGFSECRFDEGQWICNIDTALDVDDYYQLWSSNIGSWSPDIGRENLSQGNGIISSVNSYLEYPGFTQDFGMERSRSPSSRYDSNKISMLSQENHPASIENSFFPLFPEPLATVSLLFLTCISFPLFCWLCYRCFFRNGTANIQRSKVSKVLLRNAPSDNTPSIVII